MKRFDNIDHWNKYIMNIVLKLVDDGDGDVFLKYFLSSL